MILIYVICPMIMLYLALEKNKECKELKQKLAIQETENKSLRRVLFENDLIPEEFVK